MSNITDPQLVQGVSYSLLTINIFSILFYILILWAIRRDSSFLGTIYLQYIIALAFQDLVILFTIIPLYFIDQNSMPIYLWYSIGTLFYVCIISELLLHSVIAFNRFVAIVFAHKYKEIFTMTSCRCSIVTSFGISIVFLVYEIFYQNQAANVNLAINLFCWLFTLILYTVAGLATLKRVKNSLTRQQSNNLRREMKLFIQALIITSVMSIFLIFNLLPDCTSFACRMSAYGAVLAYGMAAPVSHLIVNRKLRNYVFRTLCCKGNVVGLEPTAVLAMTRLPKENPT